MHSDWHLACSLSLAAQVTSLKVRCAHAVRASMKGVVVTRPVAAGPMSRQYAVSKKLLAGKVAGQNSAATTASLRHEWMELRGVEVTRQAFSRRRAVANDSSAR